MPPDRPSVSYEYLSAILGDYLVNKSSGVDLDSVFSVLPKTQCRPFDDPVLGPPFLSLTTVLRWPRPKPTVHRYLFVQTSWSWW